MNAPTDTIPHFDVDLFSEEVMAAPYSEFRALRDAGPVVYLDRHDVFAVARYREVRHVLGEWEAFSSVDISLNKPFNDYIGEGIIRADPPVHDALRSVLSSRLAPGGVRNLEPEINRRAEEIVDRLLTRGSFDAVADLARRFPVEIVGDLIGLPKSGREPLLELIDANFNCFGPENDRTLAAVPRLAELAEYVMVSANRDVLAEGSMGRAVYDAVDAGRIPAEVAPWLVMTYVTAGMDTTVHALGHLVWLLAEHPDQWNVLRSSPSLVPQAFREVLRYESPVQVFGRTARVDWVAEDVTVPAGARLAVLYGSGNRDERKWSDADRFDVQRSNIDHLAFGYGLHGCAGQALAVLEGEAILRALLAKVARIEAGTPVRHFNNVLRGLESLPVTVTAS
ncbi:cytochrome P450 [Nocardia sp. NEAU-G5]|uniref:Cytochrome P450 n=1 Tax=Nocardia albiluteola TaxID=2842303 RepID=A0ABS6BEW2_9NOCA|nr:cytochrome P450 [Nocardia albiluteola]MBU3067768.1 cytochrome P450 [Nocardia albiluteola]